MAYILIRGTMNGRGMTQVASTDDAVSKVEVLAGYLTTAGIALREWADRGNLTGVGMSCASQLLDDYYVVWQTLEVPDWQGEERQLYNVDAFRLTWLTTGADWIAS